MAHRSSRHKTGSGGPCHTCAHSTHLLLHRRPDQQAEQLRRYHSGSAAGRTAPRRGASAHVTRGCSGCRNCCIVTSASLMHCRTICNTFALVSMFSRPRRWMSTLTDHRWKCSNSHVVLYGGCKRCGPPKPIPVALMYCQACLKDRLKVIVRETSLQRASLCE